MAWPRNKWTQGKSVARAIAVVLASTATGCPGPNCGKIVPFETDQPLTASEMHGITESWTPATWKGVSCARICSGYDTRVAVQTCSVVLPTPASPVKRTYPGGYDMVEWVPEVPGRIVCTGKRPLICKGRRPLGHVEVASDPTTVGRALAAMAHMEWASVYAFEELAGQLNDLGACEALVRRCLQAAEDERQHTRLLARFAAEHGEVVPEPARTESEDDLFTIARHNAVEGCVHETWAAYLAHEGAKRAMDPRIRAAYEVIARDESRHGQLAWDIHDWLMGELDDVAAAEVERSQAAALMTLPSLARQQARLPPELGTLPADVGARAARAFAAQFAA